MSPLAIQTHKLLEAGDATISQLKHALGRDLGSGAGYNLLQPGHQRKMSFCERLKFVEDWVQQRRCESREHNQRQRDQPDPNPVAARRDANNPVEEQVHRCAYQSDSQRFGMVAKPTEPALDANAVDKVNVMTD